MNVKILSDIHAEFHQDHGRTFVKELDATDVDVLVVAGDAGVVAGGSFAAVMAFLCNKFKHVVGVIGNHELYHSSREEVWEVVQRLQNEHPNLHVLENSTVTIEGQRFIGCTLWFPDLERYRPFRGQLNDFSIIHGFTGWFDQVNAESTNYLLHNIGVDDIVVTHHLPTHRATHPKYAGSPINGFFVCDMEETIKERKPKVWAFGHTHESMSFPLCDTLLVCNPFGYAGRDENMGFDWNLKLSVEKNRVL